MKTIPSKMTVLVFLVSYSVHDNVWELSHFLKDFPLAALLKPSLKSRFMQEFGWFSGMKHFSY